ncbi:RING-type domain-containing protein [Mycena indigotica]|uniref:RING-type domain-containing protein n=1 Tax=Mycena indigotica TaxID=2126181 RepID=A0A8H6S4H6_9AGAR|nr:RING-type domain-containing protein [Mycena indigotica]KAF7293000.1 RING-type domain-containing protein [Mycena indigotica]
MPRQTTPGAVLTQANSKKRALSEDEDSDASPEIKRPRRSVDNTPTGRDKKKRQKKKRKKSSVVAPISTVSVNSSTTRDPPSSRPSSAKGKYKASSEPPDDDVGGNTESGDREEEADPSSATIARLNQEFKAQSAVLKKHELLLAQLVQSLTCQICLDALYKPYSLSPCGHVVCYNCLVQWFTTEPDEEHAHEYPLPRKKTCPHCRARIRDRPAEAWSIKDMVVGLVKSDLVPTFSGLPPPPPQLPGQGLNNEDVPKDPWHNIFHYPHQHPGFHPLMHNGEQPSVEDMGMLDLEDGGIYRCLDCMNEIWDGVCTSCHRVYPGHQAGPDFANMFDDGESLDDGDGDEDEQLFFPHWFPMHVNLEDEDESHRDLSEDEEGGYDSFIDDDEDDVNGSQHAAEIIEIADSDDDDDVHYLPPRRRVPRFVEINSSDYEVEGENYRSPSGSPPPIRAGSRRAPNHPNSSNRRLERNVVVISDDSEGEDSDEPEPVQSSGNRRTHLDEEDSEDEPDPNHGGGGWDDFDEVRHHAEYEGEYSENDDYSD